MSATRGSFVEIDHDAMCANAMALRDLVRPAELCAVVKAGGYGHGAVAAAHAAVRGGATWIAVATIPEGEELRRVGIEVPILVLAEPRAAGFAEAIAASLSVMVYSASGIDAAIDAARSADEPLRVHLKVDTGMARVGATPAQAVDAVRRLNESPVILEGVCTHLASADDPDQRSSRRQLELFEAFLGAAKSLLPDTVVIHAANTAGAIAFPEARYDLVRCGIGLYGIGPTPAMAAAAGLTPSLPL
jgi:alanine racemase